MCSLEKGKLPEDTPLTPSSPVLDMQEITIGDSNVYVYPDFKTYKNRVGEIEGGE